jgi:hypothetical protein
MVNAIAHQTAANDPEEFIERFSERIHALSALRNYSFGTNGKGSRSRRCFARKSHTLPT